MAIDPATATLIAGGIGSALGFIGQRKANKTNREIAREQMEFQERMRATQYQTAVGDMKAAGLNPMLAYQHGGAGTPPGSSTRVESSLGAGVNSAKDAAMTFSQARLVNAQAEVADSQTGKNLMEIAFLESQIPKMQQDTATSAEMAKVHQTQAQMNTAMTEEIGARIEKMYYDRNLTYAQYQKIRAELPNIVKEGRLIDAQVTSNYAKALMDDINSDLKSYERAKAYAEQEMWRSDYGRNVRPYLQGGAAQLPFGAMGAFQEWLKEFDNRNEKVAPKRGGATGKY